MIRTSAAITTLLAVCIALAGDGALAQPVQRPSNAAEIGEGGNTGTGPGADMSPRSTAALVNSAVLEVPKIPAGPFKADWDSIKQNYKAPLWFFDAKFGIFMHWGLYSVPAHGGGNAGASEWYETHLYGGSVLAWHTQTFGSLDVFGYKDFIPLFTAAKFDPDAWALLFKKSGAKYVIPTGQHHDNFSLWDSKANPISAKNMGPKRDLIGELSVAIRKQGLKFGISNHGIEAFEFVKPTAEITAQLKDKQLDIWDPKWITFYNAGDRSAAAQKAFFINWAQRNVELIEQYHPDMLWYDNGVDARYLDPLKLWLAAYYYNSAAARQQEVSISTKKAAYAPDDSNIHTIGSIIDFEKIGARSPAGIRTGTWQVDDPIGSNWGYADGMTVASAAGVVGKLIDTVSQGGNYLLNISPMADGTIPQNQQNTLLGVGEWLNVNGEAIYGTHSWSTFSETGRGHIRYTVKGDDLYAIVVGQYPAEINLALLAAGQAPEGKITGLTMLGAQGQLKFTQDATGLHITTPATAPCKIAYAVKISGLKMNPSTFTADGNPR